MNNEIKEILECMEEIADCTFTTDTFELNFEDTKILLDYINNLQENERLNNGYCELKVKCNNGECDCTNEEYDGMVEANMKKSLLLDDYKSRINKALDYIKHSQSYGTMAQVMPHLKPYVNGDDLLEILGDKGEDKE